MRKRRARRERINNGVTKKRSRETETFCPGCGAATPNGRAGCQALFDEVLAREFGDYRYVRFHQLTVWRSGFEVSQLRVPYEFQRGGNEMMRIRRASRR